MYILICIYRQGGRDQSRLIPDLILPLIPPINSLQIQPCSESESRSEFIHCIHACTPTSWPDLDPCDLPTSMPLLEVGIYLCIAVTFQKRQIQHDVNKKSYWSWSLGRDCSGRFRSRFGYLKRRKVLIFWKWHVKAVPCNNLSEANFFSCNLSNYIPHISPF